MSISVFLVGCLSCLSYNVRLMTDKNRSCVVNQASLLHQLDNPYHLVQEHLLQDIWYKEIECLLYLTILLYISSWATKFRTIHGAGGGGENTFSTSLLGTIDGEREVHRLGCHHRVVFTSRTGWFSTALDSRVGIV